jgi:hypothetical protein
MGLTDFPKIVGAFENRSLRESKGQSLNPVHYRYED